MLYEARLKEQRDIWSIEDGAEQRGRQAGRQELKQEMLNFLRSGHTLEEAEKHF
jgi:predicted transposase YdaD